MDASVSNTQRLLIVLARICHSFVGLRSALQSSRQWGVFCRLLVFVGVLLLVRTLRRRLLLRRVCQAGVGGVLARLLLGLGG